ncbi:MAG TPA: 2-C-methyl-D-erythritol 4-phosphate cytidylyltransferase [Candidatus Polarisedimenticolia bacterium]|nr:2-C-methyl-D-erythritol 4-phosphate cytidylyltransferase [Candidatus Polarisedimenticolia bacterium]
MRTAAIIVAAGRGRRMDSLLPKVLLPLAGRTVLAWSVGAFLHHPGIDRVIIAVADEAAARRALADDAGRVRLVAGGERRQDSVLNGLDAAGDVDIVLVHDAARPLIESSLIDAVIAAAAEFGAAVPITPVAATVKRLGGDGFILTTVPRENLGLAQTPQGFQTRLLRRAFDSISAGHHATDDAALVERLGVRVRAVDGSPRNIKITVPADLAVAEALLAGTERLESGDG